MRSSGELSTGVIAGIAVVSITVGVAAALFVVVFWRWQRASNTRRFNQRIKNESQMNALGALKTDSLPCD